MCYIILTESYWTVISAITGIITCVLALWGNPNLFRWYRAEIKTAKILKKNNSLCAYVVIRSKCSFEIVVSQIQFAFGKNGFPLTFGRDENIILKPYETKELYFDLVQTCGANSTDKKIYIKQLDSSDVCCAKVYVRTSLGPCSHNLTKDELSETIRAYKQIVDQRGTK
ncbi:MAG: hypothetical protein J6S74_03155 [Alphaproteobacteria bacterium]|nr:hypothetical protein [Alphaproteobacteria bacterium]